MAMTDLIPWKRSNQTLALRQRATDPFGQLRQEIDQMFNSVLGDSRLFDRGMPSFMPTVEVRESAKAIQVNAELPGLEQKDIEVSMLEGALWIKGEKRQEHEEEEGETYRCERQYGRFERVIQLPAEVDGDNIKATFKHGLLNITLPKTKEAQSSRRVIAVES